MLEEISNDDMSASDSRARLLRTAKILLALNEHYATSSTVDADLDALLAFVAEAHSEGKQICSTDLVRLRRFGTLPTVTVKLNELSRLGLIARRVNHDKRVKVIEPTAAAEAHFARSARLMVDALSR